MPMREVEGVCRLCRQHRKLQDSHFLPRALYTFCFRPEERSGLFVSGSKSWLSSEQVSQHLLCDECEQRFNQRGEAWTLWHCYRGKHFRLRELLNAAQPDSESDTLRLYSANDIPGLNTEALAYFAISVLWRGAAASWRFSKDDIEEPIDLGPYEEPFRRYLLDSDSFPLNTAVTISVASFEGPLLRAMKFPEGSVADGYRTFLFNIPGISFMIFVGKKIPDEVMEFQAAGPGRFILLTDYEKHLAGDIMSKLKTARAIGKAPKLALLGGNT
jgi:hypothetical protein